MVLLITGTTMTQPSYCYQFRMLCQLGPSCMSAFPYLSIDYEESTGQTVMVGPIVDQAALHGILMHIRDLGLPLIEVKRIASNCE